MEFLIFIIGFTILLIKYIKERKVKDRDDLERRRITNTGKRMTDEALERQLRSEVSRNLIGTVHAVSMICPPLGELKIPEEEMTVRVLMATKGKLMVLDSISGIRYKPWHGKTRDECVDNAVRYVACIAWIDEQLQKQGVSPMVFIEENTYKRYDIPTIQAMYQSGETLPGKFTWESLLHRY